MMTIDEIKEQVEKQMLSINNVVSVGIGYKKVAGKSTGEISIILGVKKKVPLSELKPQDIIPESIDEYKTDVIEVGEIKALTLRTDRIRPAVRGVSIGHPDITAGTFGALVRKNGKTYILSNNHVLGNSNNAKPGDPIIQPGSYDSGTVGSDTLATFSELIPIEFIGDPSTCSIAKAYAWVGNVIASLFGRKSRLLAYTTAPQDNLVDLAIAEVNEDMVSNLSYEGWREIQGTQSAFIGQNVKKSGRTTGSTYGTVTQVNVTTAVSYGSGKTAIFRDQIIIESRIAGQGFSAGGDSGSIIQDMQDFAVGLLFAGSDTLTVANRIENVVDLLEIEIGNNN